RWYGECPAEWHLKADFRTFWDAVTGETGLPGAGMLGARFYAEEPGAGVWDVTCHIAHWTTDVQDALDALGTRVSVFTHSLQPSPDLLDTSDEVTAVAAHLDRFIGLAGILFALCGAAEGELVHERYGVYTRFGALGRPLVHAWWSSPKCGAEFEAPTARGTLPGGATIEVGSPAGVGWGRDIPVPVTPARWSLIDAAPVPDPVDGPIGDAGEAAD